MSDWLPVRAQLAHSVAAGWTQRGDPVLLSSSALRTIAPEFGHVAKSRGFASIWTSRFAGVAFPFRAAAQKAAPADEPNIVIIWGDDIGQSDISGLMGYRTPNIDSIAQRGVIFTDYYGERSCT